MYMPDINTDCYIELYRIVSKKYNSSIQLSACVYVCNVSLLLLVIDTSRLIDKVVPQKKSVKDLTYFWSDRTSIRSGYMRRDGKGRRGKGKVFVHIFG